MANEGVDTTNKLIKPDDISKSDDAVIQQLSENLQDITPEDIDGMCDEIEEAEKRSEFPAKELEDFRERWKEKIEDINERVKKTIIEKTKEIPVKVEVDSDGCRLIEFSIGDKTRKILDPKLEKYSESFRPSWDNGYIESIKRIYDRDYVTLNGMVGDVDKRENKKLREYVKKKRGDGFDMATEEQIKEILLALGKKANLDSEIDQMVMFMYLTGIDGLYWLKDISVSGRFRWYMECSYNHRCFGFTNSEEHNASLCMIACQKDHVEEDTPIADPKQEMIDFFSKVNNDPNSYY